MKPLPILALIVALILPPCAVADEVRTNDTGGFNIYSDDGEYIGRVIPNDTGGYDVRALDGRKVDSVDSTGDADTDLLILKELVDDSSQSFD